MSRLKRTDTHSFNPNPESLNSPQPKLLMQSRQPQQQLVGVVRVFGFVGCFGFFGFLGQQPRRRTLRSPSIAETAFWDVKAGGLGICSCKMLWDCTMLQVTDLFGNPLPLAPV